MAKAAKHFPEPVTGWAVCGGGRRNPVLMRELRANLAAEVLDVDDLGWDGDNLEAACFGYLAVRHLRDLPLSFPRTTRVPRAMTAVCF